ncbi:MAG: hypothetical protein Q9191_003795, partial [Dirinaria sp. TL-2023a]
MATHTGLTAAVLDYRAPEGVAVGFEVRPDRANFADPTKKSLLSGASKVDDLTPYIGTQLHGLQLSQLTDVQKDELALLVAERGVVFLRDQDLTLDQQYDLTTHYGDANPPAYTMLRMVKAPPTGGDTIWTSQVALFDKLSPALQQLFEGLHGVHSSEASYINAINGGGQSFRPPVRRDHPLVRTHPVTKLKSLFYNPTVMIHIKELKAQEGEHLLSFLRDHMHSADDLSVRWRWEPGSIAIWDNRTVAHRAVPGGYDKTLREGKRTAIFGERPAYDPTGQSWSERYQNDAAKAHSVNSGQEGFDYARVDSNA